MKITTRFAVALAAALFLLAPASAQQVLRSQTISFDNYAALKSAPFARFSDGAAVIVAESSNGGVFIRETADISACVANDTAEAICIADPLDLTGASGGFVRQFDGQLQAGWFGVKSGAGQDNTVALGYIRDYVDANGGGFEIEFPAGIFPFDPIVFRSGNMIIGSRTGSDDIAGNVPDTTTGTVLVHRAAATPGMLITFDTETSAAQVYGGGVQNLQIDLQNHGLGGVMLMSSRYSLIDNVLISRYTSQCIEANSDGVGKQLVDYGIIRNVQCRIGGNAANYNANGILLAGDGFSATAGTFAATSFMLDSVLVEYNDGYCLRRRAIDSVTTIGIKCVERDDDSDGVGSAILDDSANQTYSSFSVTGAADNGNGRARFTTAAPHLISSAGILVKLSGCSVSGYNGIYYASYASATTFDIYELAYSASSTCTGGAIFPSIKNFDAHVKRGSIKTDRGAANVIGFLNAEGSGLVAGPNGAGITHIIALQDRLTGAVYGHKPYVLADTIDMDMAAAFPTTATQAAVNGFPLWIMADGASSTVTKSRPPKFDWGTGYLKGIEIIWAASAAGTCDIDLDVSIRTRSNRQAFGGTSAPTGHNQAMVLSDPGAANTMYRDYFDFTSDVTMYEGSPLSVVINRDATGGNASDTCTASFYLIDAVLYYESLPPKGTGFIVPVRNYEKPPIPRGEH